jgi:hypothetical protein
VIRTGLIQLWALLDGVATVQAGETVVGYNVAPEPTQVAGLLCGIVALWLLVRGRRRA